MNGLISRSVGKSVIGSGAGRGREVGGGGGYGKVFNMGSVSRSV